METKATINGILVSPVTEENIESNKALTKQVLLAHCNLHKIFIKTGPVSKTEIVETIVDYYESLAEYKKPVSIPPAPEAPSVPSPTNAVEGTVYCGVCKSHVKASTAMRTSDANIWMCKKFCNPKSISDIAKKAEAAAAKAIVKDHKEKAPKTPKTPRTTNASLQDLATFIVLPATRFSVGDRSTIYEFVNANPNASLTAIAEHLSQSIGSVRGKVCAMVSDFKLKPSDYSLFPNPSTAKSILTAVGDWTAENQESYSNRLAL